MNNIHNLTIVILTYRTNEKILADCINSIDPQANILIVENSNNSAFKEKIENQYPDSKVILSGKNLGYGGGNNFGLSNLYSRSLFFQGMFLESDKIKKDSLFLKGAEIAKYSVLNDSLFKSILNKTIGDYNFKILSALSIAPKELVPGMYWWATNKLWYLNNKPAIERVNHRELLEIIMHRIISIEPDYLYGGPYRFFGIFYSRIPGVEITQSKSYFEKANSSHPNYFGNKVQMSEFYHQKAENRNLFHNQLQSIINIDPIINPETTPENIFYQKRAVHFLNQEEVLFE